MKKLLIEDVFMACQTKEGFDRGVFHAKMGAMSDAEFSDFMDGLKRLIHHKDSTSGLYATDQEPHYLLERFWQRTSDACPLEATKAEAESNAFHSWVDDRCFKIDF